MCMDNEKAQQLLMVIREMDASLGTLIELDKSTPQVNLKPVVGELLHLQFRAIELLVENYPELRQYDT